VKILLLAAALAAASVSEAAAHADCEGFDSVLERDNTHVYARKVEGSPVREFCATARVEAAPSEVYALLLDVESYPSRIPPTVVAEKVSSSGNESVYYMVIDPGFITRRDYCIATQASTEGSGYLVTWHQVDCPRRPGRLMRMVANSGSWKVTPLDGGTASAVVYHAHADPGGLIPNWMINAGTARGVPPIMAALRHAVSHGVKTSLR
jgi:hypothetical protein